MLILETNCQLCLHIYLFIAPFKVEPEWVWNVHYKPSPHVVPMVTALLLRTVTWEVTEPKVYEPTKNFIITFLLLNAWKLLKIMLKYRYLCLTLSTPKCYFFVGRHFFIRKMKIKMADRKKHVLSKVVKNIIFQNKTLLVMFYRHNKTFWYQFCNFKHFLKAENSEDSLASSCVEFSIGLSCNPVWDWVTIGPTPHGCERQAEIFQLRGRKKAGSLVNCPQNLIRAYKMLKWYVPIAF